MYQNIIQLLTKVERLHKTICLFADKPTLHLQRLELLLRAMQRANRYQPLSYFIQIPTAKTRRMFALK